MDFRQGVAIVDESTGKHVEECIGDVLVFACVQLLFEAIDLGLEPLLRNLALTLGALLAKLLQFVDLRTETGSCRSERSGGCAPVWGHENRGLVRLGGWLRSRWPGLTLKRCFGDPVPPCCR